MKKIMILGASVLQVPAIEEAKKLGYYVIAVDMNKDAVGMPLADKSYVVSTIDMEEVLKVAKQEKIDAITTIASDMPMRTVAYVCEKMNLKGISMDTAIKATDKYEMRKVMKGNNVPIPMFFHTNNFDNFCKIVKNMPIPYIVKPSDNSGSRGIFKVETEKIDLKEVYEYVTKNSRKGWILVEEYMEGPEVSVESITYNGVTEVIAITDKLTTGSPYFVEMGHSQYTKHSKKTQNEIKKITKMAIDAVGITNGPSHTEIKITKDGPKIVEIGARLGGDNINTHLVPLSTGINIVRESLKIAMGEEPIIKFKYNKGSAIRYISGSKGIIKGISDIDNIKKEDGVEVIHIDKKIGEEVSNIRSSNDRIGYVIATATTPEEAIKKCENAIENIKIELTAV